MLYDHAQQFFVKLRKREVSLLRSLRALEKTFQVILK
jgi:hypothetical protein